MGGREGAVSRPIRAGGEKRLADDHDKGLEGRNREGRRGKTWSLYKLLLGIQAPLSYLLGRIPFWHVGCEHNKKRDLTGMRLHSVQWVPSHGLRSDTLWEFMVLGDKTFEGRRAGV